MPNSSFYSKPLGQLLIEAGLISINQVELALQEQKETGLRIGEILVDYGWIDQKTVDFFGDRWFSLLQERKKKPFQYYLKEAGLMNDEEISRIIKIQQLKHEKVKFYRLVVEQGYIKKITAYFFLAYLYNVLDTEKISTGTIYTILKSYSKGERTFIEQDLCQANLMGITLKNINLNTSNLNRADLTKINLSGSSSIEVNLDKANLDRAILVGVNFSNSSAKKANFKDANLEQANFQSANLRETNFQGAYLHKANFSKADLTGAKLDPTFSYDVYYDRYTIFDYDFDPKFARWIMKKDIS